MHSIFTLARFYPFWALPLALVLAELGRHFRRKNSPLYGPFWAIAGFLVVGTVAWIFFRGDVNSDQWIKTVSDH
jgi:hypothetical protein